MSPMDRDSAENTRNKDPCRHFILLIIGAAALGVLIQATENFIVKSIRSMLHLGPQATAQCEGKFPFT